MRMALGWVLFASAACGSGGTTSGGDAPVDVYSTLTLDWTLQTAAGVVQPCPVGFDTAVLEVTDPRGGVQSSSSVPCAAGTGTIMALTKPANEETYDVGVAITDGAHQTFGLSNFVDTYGLPDGKQLSLRVITDRGRLDVNWTLAQGGVPVDCDGLGNPATTVTVTPATGAPATASTQCVRPVVFPELPSGPATVEVTMGSNTTMANAMVPTGEQTAAATVPLTF